MSHIHSSIHDGDLIAVFGAIIKNESTFSNFFQFSWTGSLASKNQEPVEGTLISDNYFKEVAHLTNLWTEETGN